MSNTYTPPLPRPGRCNPSSHLKDGGCYECCDNCNYDKHTCHFCGDSLTHDSFIRRRFYNHYNEEWESIKVKHYLSDCRPDLIDGSYDGTKMTDGPLT